MGNVNTYIHLYVQFDIYMKVSKILIKRQKQKNKENLGEKDSHWGERNTKSMDTSLGRQTAQGRQCQENFLLICNNY